MVRRLIVLVEDNHLDQELFKYSCFEAGVDCLACPSVLDLETFTKFDPLAYFVDLSSNEMGREETLSHIMASPLISKIVIFTGYDLGLGEVKEFKEIGGLAFYNKNIDTHFLTSLLRAL